MRAIFTGIIEEIGFISDIKRGAHSIRLGVKAEKILEDVKLGDSIAVNGVCLTVVQFESRQFWADVMPETFAKTTLRDLTLGSPVNLERALRLSDRLGGHLVQGHVDGIGSIIKRERFEIAIVYKIKAPPEVLKYTVAKGSIAIDGVSLTVVEVGSDYLTVSLIPHTAHLTVLGSKQPGQEVNLESDIIGRYVERLLSRTDQPLNGSLSMDFLSQHGFL